MHFKLALLSFGLILGTFIALLFAYLGWLRRRENGALAFIFMMLAIAIWSFSYAVEQFTPHLNQKIFWHKMAYLGIPYVPLFWFIFNAQILRLRIVARLQWILLFSVIPVLMSVLTLTMESHQWVWGSLRLDSVEELTYLSLERKAEFYLFVGYSYILLILGTIIYVRLLWRSPSLSITTITILISAVALPIILNILRIVFSIDPFMPYDLTPIALTTTGSTAGWFIFRFGLLDVLSVARIALLESMNDGVIVADLLGRVVSINGRAQKMLRHACNDFIGQQVEALIPDHGHTNYNCPSLERNANGESRTGGISKLEHQPVHREIHIPAGAGGKDEQFIDISISCLYDRRNRLQGTLYVLRDITQRKRTQEVLLQAQRMESAGLLAGGVAHDFNNLLATISMRHQLAVKSLDQDAPALRHISIASTAVDRAADLTRQLLAYTGKGNFKVEPFDINSLILSNQALLESAIPKQIDFDISLPPFVLSVKADRGQLQQVVMNLVLNAVEAVESGEGEVDIRTGFCQLDPEDVKNYLWKDAPTCREYVYLQVSDNGVGMSSEVQKRIFEPFFTTKPEGRGLGLSALLGAIHVYDGGVSVDSQPGRGATFKVLLPRSSDMPMNGDLSTMSASRDMKIQLDGTILVVDDEQPILDGLSEVFGQSGMNVLTATNGEQALERFERSQEKIDLVLLDAQMPIMGGIEALYHLRQLNPSLCALLSSGYSKTEVSSTVDWNANTDFIQKPYGLDQLIDKVDALLRRVPEKSLD